jgi:hypothetical protein
MELERQLLIDGDEFAAFQLEGEGEIFGRFAGDLMDDVEIDYDTQEYRINGGRWINAVTVDSTGVSVDFPELVSLNSEELGSLAPIMQDIMAETRISIRAARVVAAQDLCRS